MTRTELILIGSVAFILLLILFGSRVLAPVPFSVGGDLEPLDASTNRLTHGVVTCGATSTQVAAAQGRSWFRFTNTGGSDITIRLASSTISAATIVPVDQGIILHSSTSTGPGVTYFDSREAGIVWDGVIGCIADTTGTTMGYIISR